MGFMSNKELKAIVVKAMKDYYGFAPKISQITLEEAHNDGSYILFNVSGIVYRYYNFRIERVEE